LVYKEKISVELDDHLIAYKECKNEKKKRMLHLTIVESSMYLVKAIASEISFKSGVSVEDLIQVGSIGLIKAIEFYVPNKNAKFKTYAKHLIKGEIKHYLRDKASLIKAPRELQELVTRIRFAINTLKERGFEEPTTEQISVETGISEVKILEVLEIENCKSTLSLDQSFSHEDEEISLIEKIPAGDYQEILNSYEDKIMISSAIKKLPPDLREIIMLSYFEDLNQREISEKLNISQMQVSRGLKKALNKLYEIIKYKEN